jgi:hypothetical protein
MIILQYPLIASCIFATDHFSDSISAYRKCFILIYLRSDLNFPYRTTYGLYTHIFVAQKLVESTV